MVLETRDRVLAYHEQRRERGKRGREGGKSTFILLNDFFMSSSKILPTFNSSNSTSSFLFLENRPDTKNNEVHAYVMWFVKCQVIQRRETLPRISRCFCDIFESQKLWDLETAKFSGPSQSHYFLESSRQQVFTWLYFLMVTVVGLCHVFN